MNLQMIFRLAGPVLMCAAVGAEAPVIDPADDAKNFGLPEDVLFWSPEQQVAGYRNVNKLFATRAIPAGDSPFPLPERLADLGAVPFVAGAGRMTVDEFFVGHNVAGLLVIKDGSIAYERYGLGNTRDTRWLSFSVAKSVTSMLIGAAIRDGYIKSVDEKVSDYLPRLKGSSYDQATIRDLLQMASGVQWNEDYADPDSDVNKSVSMSVLDVYGYLGNKRRAHAPGTVFNYNSSETDLAGTLLRSAIGNNQAMYLAEKIWKPFGMAADANWLLFGPGGGERGGCCISATLRDYARIGLFALHDGVLRDGTQVLPEGWMKESTTPSRGYDGYGYLWWLRSDGIYSALGIFGQIIYVNDQEDVVIALHSARETADDDQEWALSYAMFDALTNALNN